MTLDSFQVMCFVIAAIAGTSLFHKILREFSK